MTEAELDSIEASIDEGFLDPGGHHRTALLAEVRRLAKVVEGLPKWTPVAERLPMSDGEVLVLNRYGRCNVGHWCTHLGVRRWYGVAGEAVAWMPLPDTVSAEQAAASNAEAGKGE